MKALLWKIAPRYMMRRWEAKERQREADEREAARRTVKWLYSMFGDRCP